MRGILSTLLMALALGAVTVDAARAYRVSPLIMNMELERGQTVKRMTVTNPDAFDKAIVVTAHETRISPTGQRMMEPGEAADMLVFPPQALVRPGATQTFAVQWLGDPALARSRTFTIAFRQISVSDRPAPGGGALEIMVNVLTTLSVQPPGATYEAVAASVRATGQPAAGQDGTPGVALDVTNSGPFHAYISDADITLSAGNWRESIEANDVILDIGEGLVLPGSTRRFVLSTPPPPGATAIAVNLNFADRGFRGRR